LASGVPAASVVVLARVKLTLIVRTNAAQKPKLEVATKAVVVMEEVSLNAIKIVTQNKE